MAKKKRKNRNGHALDDNGAYLPSKNRIEELTSEYRRKGMYVTEYRKRKYGKLAMEVVRTDDSGLPTPD